MDPQTAPKAPQVESSISFPKRKWVRNAGFVLLTIAALYAMIYADVVLRARESYLEGEKYSRWHENPAEKKKDLDARFESRKRALDKKRSSGKLSQEEYDRQLEVLQFDRDREAAESSIKYAYVWYKTAYELFSPPESKWVKLSREKAPAAREKWKEELRSKNIPFEEYMLD